MPEPSGWGGENTKPQAEAWGIRQSQTSNLHSIWPRLLSLIDRDVARTLDRALAGEDVTVEEATRLFDAEGLELNALVIVADELRRRSVGDVVTYILNRNINFTNVCIKHCGFCAFSRDHREEEGYFLPIEEVVRRAREAWDLGATEVCIQAGLPPKMDGYFYVDLTRAIKKELPDIHIHGFSPEEVLYGSVRARCSIEEYLRALKDAGVGSLPGTSAEILDDEVRNLISPGRITTAQWVEVITTAHRLGIPTTSTIMYGHVENSRHKAAHIALLRDLQRQTGGFTEFVPLSFIFEEAPMYKKGFVADVRTGATGAEVVKMYAVSRIMLNSWIPNLQVSWVKEGPKLAQVCLNVGCNDFMGTLINESISTAAGAAYGQRLKPREMRRLIRDIGRVPAERTTTYEIRRLFSRNEDDHHDPLDLVDEEGEEGFGSYHQLIHRQDYRFKDQFQLRVTPEPSRK
ncbi:MAG: 5-amino-6-(D-ribitylamino)uracil--L-tyrosine 4-hydroxyphenyl transferase CofH [Chloroflexi bacterium]|nr:5-amino-6-(D-ribitylamino)uracil--L-tyrosine 4-hydroxyphenyl transferase CofH [Chloroflexota bacterium]